MTGRRLNQRGISIVELLVVVVMMGLVTVSVMSLFQTTQRQSYTQDEVVEVQQNLRIAMERISRDIRMAGFMVTASPLGNAPNQPVDANGDNDCTDAGEACFRINTASASGRIGRIVAINGNRSASVAIGTAPVYNVASVEMAQIFRNDDWVRIIRPPNHQQVVNDAFQIQNDPAPASSLLTCDNVGAGGEFLAGDVMVRVTGSATFPETIEYFLNTATGDLRRSVNGTNSQIVGSKVTDLEFEYLLDNGAEVATTTDLGAVRAVRVTLTGETSAQETGSANYGTGGVRTREHSQVIALRNR